MRTIARATGAHVTGITINEYQVRRCREHNVRQGLAAQCAVVQGNFLELPFPEGSFDAAYCVEAACHAPSLEALYRQVFAVLKPGARFASYEWLRTPKYDPGNAEHVAIVDKVAVGNALPDVRDLEAVLAAAAAAGFEVVSTQDAALTGAVPWHRAMTSARMGAYLTHLITSVMEAVRWAPKARSSARTLWPRAGGRASPVVLAPFPPCRCLALWLTDPRQQQHPTPPWPPARAGHRRGARLPARSRDRP